MQVAKILTFRHYLLPVPQYWKNLSLENIDGEIWQPIVGYEDTYEVSNLGRIKSLPKTIITPNTPNGRTTKIKILNQQINRFQGRLTLNLYKEKKGRTWYVHILVAKAFVPNPQLKSTVNHCDGIKLSNWALNLEWNTHLENVQHAVRAGLCMNYNERNFFSKFTNEQVLEIRKLGAQNILRTEIQKLFKISRMQVSRILSGESRAHVF